MGPQLAEVGELAVLDPGHQLRRQEVLNPLCEVFDRRP
jgi:hypothetical protein